MPRIDYTHKTIGSDRLSMCGQPVGIGRFSRVWIKDDKLIVDCPECLRLMSEHTKKIFNKKGIKKQEVL